MSRNFARLLLAALCFVWMALIYSFSAQSGTASGSLSAVFSQPVTDIIANLQKLSPQEAADLFLKVDHVIRKIAHVTEYALLGAILTVTLRSFNVKQPFIPLAIGTVYALADEFHQSFSPDRTPQFADVLLDASGVAAGIGVVCLILFCWRKCHVHRERPV